MLEPAPRAGDAPSAALLLFSPLHHLRKTPAVPLVIRPRDDVAIRADLTGITPDLLAGLEPSAVARRPIGAGGRAAALADLFSIDGSAADGRIECHGDFSLVSGIGAGMASGTLHVAGSVGRHAAWGMSGGTVVVEGNAGDWLAATMTGGLVRVEGDAGDDLAAAPPGAVVGVTGGMVVVNGCAGTRTASRMRRGIVAIAGDCGAAPGFEIRAGSLLVAGRLGDHPGLGMRRGSIIAAGPPPLPGPTFRRGARWCPPFLPLLSRRLAAAGFRPKYRAGAEPPRVSEGNEDWAAGPWVHWHGDIVTGSRGELFTLHPA